MIRTCSKTSHSGPSKHDVKKASHRTWGGGASSVLYSHTPSPPCIGGLSYYFLDGVLVAKVVILLTLSRSDFAAHRGGSRAIKCTDLYIWHPGGWLYDLIRQITIAGSAAYQLKYTTDNASQTSQTKGYSIGVRWVGVVTGARTSVAKAWMSTLSCWAASTQPSKDARTFSSTVATQVCWLKYLSI